jgi:hypothetical protein
VSRKLRYLVVAVAAAAALAAPAGAWAGDFVATATLSGHEATPESPVVASVDFGGLEFISIQEVCLNFTFNGDLLDPGDQLVYTPLDHSPSPAGGFTNVGQTAQASRSSCVPNDGLHGDFPLVFRDGHENRIEIAMWQGSVRISELTVSIIGAAVLAAPTQTVTLTFRSESGRTVTWSGAVTGGALEATYRADGLLTGLHGSGQLAGGTSVSTDFDTRGIGHLIGGSMTATRGSQRIAAKNVIGLASSDGIELASRATYYDGRNTQFGSLSIRIGVPAGS